MPYNIKEQPTLTFVARQEGEAWNRPFVAVYEPSTVKEAERISSVTFPEVECKQPGSHVGICVKQKNGRMDYILSSDSAAYLCSMNNGMKASSTYALWGNRRGEDCTFFLGNAPVNVLLEKESNGWYYTASGACTITLNGKTYKIKKCVMEKTKL